MKVKSIIVFVLIAAAFMNNSCKKKEDRPPLHSPFHKHYSVTELKSIAGCTNTCNKRFTEDVFFTGVVVADQVSGNFYKEIYLRDRYNTGGLRIDLITSASYFFVGDSLRLSLKGYDIGFNERTGMLEIDSVDFEKSMIKFSTGPAPQPRVVDLAVDTYTDYLCDLIVINNVSFIPADTNQIWADAIMQLSVNRTIQDCAGNQVAVRTSNYASFASQKTPKGAGSIIGIATAYGATNQLAIRKPSEVNMNGPGCTLYLKKDFDDASIISGGWTQQALSDPSVTWYTSTHTGYLNGDYAKISGYYSATNHNAETWLISPSLNLSAGNNPVMSFVTMANFSGNALEVLVSTNYTGGLPSTATWTNLSGFNLSTTGYSLTPSGLISLGAYKTANTRIAFKYTSTTSASKTFELDDIVIREN